MLKFDYLRSSRLHFLHFWLDSCIVRSHEQQDEVRDGFLVEPQNQGRTETTWEPSHEWRWRRLHRVRGVSGCSPENHLVPWLIHKAKTEEPKTELQQRQTGLTGGSDRFDRWVPV
jgi:hypothetical protein